MKAALFLAVAGVAVAQNLSGEPACATSCLSSAISAVGCAPTDMACQCGPSMAAIGASVAPCLLSACTAASDLAQAASVGSALCAAFSSTMGSSATSTNTMSITSTSTTVSESSSPSAGTTTTSRSSTGSNSTFTTKAPTSSPTPQSTNAAASPVALGVGALGAFLAAIAAL